MTPAEAKAALRREMAERRAAAHAVGQGAAAAHLSALLAGQGGAVLSGYWPMRSEIDPRPAMAAHRGPVCLPVIEGRGLPLRFREWHPGAAMVAGPFGAMVPEGGDWLVPGVLIVPLLAWDRRGFRLGYGGGFYDRTLAALRAAGGCLAVGFAFAAQEVEAVPVDATDARLDHLATERGVEF